MSRAPELHVDFFGRDHNPMCDDVESWQAEMSWRGWLLDVDGTFGVQSDETCRRFQASKGLAVDGLVGPDTWGATWDTPVDQAEIDAMLETSGSDDAEHA